MLSAPNGYQSHVTRRLLRNPHLKSLEQALASRFGWQPDSRLRDTILGFVSKKALRLGLDDVSYCRMAAMSLGELHALAEEIADGETRFFRSMDHVEALRTRVLPELIALRKPQRKLRLWSAACSTGEEAYSLAMLVRDVLPTTDDVRVELFASDLRGQAIMAASRARFRASSIRMIDPTIRNRYFIGLEEPSVDREFELIPIVRRMVTFRRANLCEPHVWRQLPGPYDLIQCQNLLLYFHPRAVENVVERLARILAPEGYLIVDRTEVELISRVLFRPVQTLPNGFFQRREIVAPETGGKATADVQ